MQTKQIKILKQSLDYSHSSRNEHLFFCPFCKHHKPKLSVNIEKNVFKCWVCDTRGKNNYYLLKRFGTFSQQQKWLQTTNEVDIRDFELFVSGSETEQKVKQKIDLPDGYKPLFAGSDYLYSQRPLNYLKKRKISQRQIFDLKIGYCTGGEYKDRIIIPSFDEDGDINYFIARSYVGDWMRYKNPPVSRDIVFNDLNIDWDLPVILVEGAFDALKEPNMIPILGSTLREDSELFQKIINNTSEIFIVLDPDAKKKETDIISKFLKYDITVHKIDIENYSDVSAMPDKVYFENKKNATKITNNNFLIFEEFLNLIV